MELEILQAHIASCTLTRRGALRWRFATQDVHRFVSGRVISSVMALAIAITLIACAL